jgi:hypothetical protein
MPHVYAFEVNGDIQGVYIDKKQFRLDTVTYIIDKLVNDGHASTSDEALTLEIDDMSMKSHLNDLVKKYTPFVYKGDRYVIHKQKAGVMKEPERKEPQSMMTNINDPLPLVPVTP